MFEPRELIMPNRFWTFGVFIFSAMILGSALFSQAAVKGSATDAGTAKEPYNIEALELSYDQDTEIYTAIGEVIIKKGGRVLKCDYAQVDHKTMIAKARGHVEFTADGDELRGEELTVDLKKQTGEVTKGRLFLKKNNFHVTGEQIWKTGESSYRVLNGTITSCDGEKVPWEIKAREFIVTVEGYGQVWHSSFRVKDIPVLYAPYMIFPAKTKRQSGLLMPEPGYSSRDGITFNLPFYWAISDNTDATFNEYFMSRRGMMQGAEFRYALSPYSKGTLMLDYLFKDGLSDEEYKNGNISKPYTERYWFRSKINQRLPWNMDLKMDLDWVSDRDYLKEFRSIPNGLDRNRKTFLSNFSRDLEDETQLVRRNAAVFTKNFGTYSFSGGFTFYQELGDTTTTLNQLPYATFDATKQALWKDLYLQWSSSYYHYWRESSDRGHVVELTPTLSYPTKFGNYLKLEGSMSMTETLYQVDNKLSSSVKSFGNRFVPNLRLDMSTDIQKIFQFSDESSGFQKMKHNIRPQVIYNYTPEIDQGSLPSFVSALSKTNTVTYYLINTFTGKSLRGKGKQGEDLFSYLDFVQIKFYQTYDINEAKKEVSASESKRPFSSIYGQLEFSPSSYLALRSSAGWSPYNGLMDYQSHNLTLSDKKGNSAYVEYLSSSGEQVRQLNTNLNWNISSLWSASFLNRYSLDQKKNYETTVGLTYTQQCWGIKIYYSDIADDKRIYFTFSLKGLGEF